MDCNDILRKYSRYLLIIFNFLFVLTGILILSIGASVKAYYNEYDRFLDDKYFYASDLLIVVGVIIFFIAFFGCCGALKENACMTLTFSTLLIVIFILELIVGIGGLVLKHKTEEWVEGALTDTMKQYNTSNHSEITGLWDDVQRDVSINDTDRVRKIQRIHRASTLVCFLLKCCGVNNYTDWLNTTLPTRGQIPISCCRFPAGSTGNISCDINHKDWIYKPGCLEVLSDYIEGHATSIEAVGLTLAMVQLFGIILSCYLSKQIKSDYETV